MRKSLLKTIVATAVVGATLALSSVVTLADAIPTVGETLTFTEAVSKPASGDSDVTKEYGNFTVFIKADKGEIASSTKSVDGVSYTHTFKTGGADSYISFTTSDSAVVKILAVSGKSGTDRTININNGTSNVATVTAKGSTLEWSDEIKLTTGGTYKLKSSSGGINFYAVSVNYSSSDKFYPANDRTKTDASSAWIGGAPLNYLNGHTLSNGAVNHGGNLYSNDRIRIGNIAHTESGETTPTIASCGYITFEREGSFEVSVNAASSGKTSSRKFYIGAVADKESLEDSDFTDIKELEVIGNTEQTVSATITNTGNKKYAIYVKPYDKDGVYSPAENTDIYKIDVAPAGAVYATIPTVALAVNSTTDERIQLKGTFNEFTTDVYTVTGLKVYAASVSETEAEATAKGWKTVNITKVRKDAENGDVYFTLNVKNMGKDAKFQAEAVYRAEVEGASDGTSYSDVLSYTAA